MRRVGILAVCIFFPACSGGEGSSYPGDALAAIEAACEQRVESPNACSSECTLAGLNAECPESDDLWGSPEMDAYLGCLDGCSAARTCSDGKIMRDCGCVRECASAQTAKLQGLLAFDADCQKALPECQ